MPPAIEENTTMVNGVNEQKESTEFNRPDANKKSFAFSILMNLSNMWRNYTKSFDTILDNYGFYEIIDFVIQHFTQHPFFAFGVLIAVLSCALPFIIFMVFATATVVMTFTGFVIIEGTLITIASALLFGFLGAVLIFFMVFSLLLLGGYFGLVQIYEIIGYPNKRQAIIEYIRGNTTINNNQRPNENIKE